MKKILTILCVFVCANVFSQSSPTNPIGWPIIQGMGNTPSTAVVTNALKAKSGLINGIYTDTTHANTNAIKQNPFAFIAISTENKVCYRNANATKWICFNSEANSTPPSVVNIITDSSIQICNVNSCDTFVVNVTAQTINVINDSTVIVCSYGGSCDTININPTPIIPTGYFVDSIWSSPGVKTDTLIYSNGLDTFHVKVYDRNCGLIDPGVVTYDSLLRFSVSPAIYILCSDGIRRTSNQTQVTLAAAHATLDRFDAIILNASGVSTITGTPALNPEQPQITPDQILLTYILVPAAATSIPACSTPDEIIYDENLGSPTEWTTSSSGLLVDFNNTVNPYHLTKAIRTGAISANGSMSFTPPTSKTIRNYTYVKFGFALRGAFLHANGFQVSWVTSAGSATVNVVDGLYGYRRKTVIDEYIVVTIPITAFIAPTAGVALQMSIPSSSQFKISFPNTNADGVNIDYIQLGGSCINQPPPSSNTPITADNGLRMSTPTNVRLGSPTTTGAPLVEKTYIDAGSLYSLNFIGTVPAGTNAGIVTAVNSGSGGNGLYGQATDGRGVYGVATTGVGVYGNASGSGIGVYGISASAHGGYFQSTSGIGAEAIVTPSSTNSVANVLKVSRVTSGTAANGIAGSIDFYNEHVDGVNYFSNSIVSEVTNVVVGSRESKLTIKGVNNTSTVDKLYIGSAATQINATRFETYKGASVAAANDLTLGTDGNVFSITGATQINAITTANWQAGSTISLIFASTPTVKHNTAGGAGTAPLLLAGSVDFVASANSVLNLVYDGTNWIETSRKVAAAGGGVSITADNGLTANTATNVRLGGTLLANTTIISAGFQLAINTTTGTTAPVSILNTTVSGAGLIVDANSTGITSFAVGIPLWAVNMSTVNNTVVTGLQINRTAVNGANGIGSHIKFQMLSSTGAQGNSGEIVNKYTNATNGSQVSRFDFNLANGGTTVGLKFAIWGEGAIKLEPITAAAASAITPAEGLILFVSDTDATFTSIGLWCYENGAWSKK